MVLTGGCSALPGIRNLASSVLGVPVRIAQPDNLVGMVDKLDSPAYSTGVGLLRWAFLMSEFIPPGNHKRGSYSRSGSDTQGGGTRMEKIKSWLTRLLP
jgi:cell division protein FtsA